MFYIFGEWRSAQLLRDTADNFLSATLSVSAPRGSIMLCRHPVYTVYTDSIFFFSEVALSTTLIFLYNDSMSGANP